MGERIAVLGGTFNPPHMGHLLMAQCVYDTGKFDKIVWMPSGDPPHKVDEHIAEKKHRLQMCQLAVAQMPHYQVSEFELFRKGKTYSYDTFEALYRQNPENEYALIIGADSLMYITKWYKADLLLKQCTMVVLNRPGFDEKTIQDEINRLSTVFQAHIDYVKMPDTPISSTEIRELCHEEMPISGLVPDAVEQYIHDYGIYHKIKPYDAVFIEELKEKAGKYHTQKRFPHTLGVLRVALKLAQLHQADPTEAAIGALLHDCAKNIPSVEKLEICRKNEIEITEVELASPDLLHAKLGAYLAQKDFGIKNLEVLDAIRYHTTGQPNMSTLEKIIFIADYIEPSRNKAPRLDAIRRAAVHDLDDALMMILEDTLHYLDNHKGHIDPKTKETYEFYRASM